MVKIISSIGCLAAICLFGACMKRQDYGGTAVEKMANGWWVVASSTDSGVITSAPGGYMNHEFFVTYNTSGNTADSIWVDDLEYIGNNYDVKGELGASLSGFTMSSGGTTNLYESGDGVLWAKGQVFPKGGHSRTGVATDSLFLQVIFAANPADTLTIKGVARTGFDGDDWPESPYTPAP